MTKTSCLTQSPDNTLLRSKTHKLLLHNITPQGRNHSGVDNKMQTSVSSLVCCSQTSIWHNGEVKGALMQGLQDNYWAMAVACPHSCALSCPVQLLLCTTAQLVISNTVNSPQIAAP